ncbi:MFS transporter, DHA1 family, tetracycline resistance protein [Azospirillaceae bacterium]
MRHQVTRPAARIPALSFIFITIVLDVLALGVVIPVLPRLISEFLNNDTVHAAETVGAFATLWALMQFLCSPILGGLSDHFGRRPVILLSNFGLGLDYIFMGFAPSLGWLLVGRVISGITSASFATAAAYIVDVTSPEKRAAGFGVQGAAFGLGFVLGPALGGLLGAVDVRLPFWTAAALSLGNGVYGSFILPESLPLERRKQFSWKRANPIGSLALLRSNHRLLGLALIALLSNLAHEALPSTFVLYVGFRYGWDQQTIGFSLAAIGLCSAIVQGGMVRPLTTRLGERGMALTGLTFGIIGFFCLGSSRSGSLMWIAIPSLALWGMFGPAAQSLMSRCVPASEQGLLQGALSSLKGVTGMIGPGLFSLTFSFFIGANAFGDGVPGAPYILASLLLCGALFEMRRRF